MSSPVAQLVPRGASKANKRRPGFRPVGKSKASSSANKKNKSVSISRTTKPQPSQECSENDDSAKQIPIVTQPSQADEESTEEVAPKLVTTKTNLKKRKQTTSISIGFRKTPVPQIIEPPAKRQSTEVEATEGLSSQKSSSSSSPTTTNTSQTPRISNAVQNNNAANSTPYSESQDLLQKLLAENRDGVRLNSFCSSFKVKKKNRRRKEAEAANQPGQTTNTSASNKKQSQQNIRNQGNPEVAPIVERDKTPDVSGAPVVTIVDGEIVLQEASLTVPGQRRTVQEVEEEFQDVIEEDAQLAIVGASYTSFVNRKGPQHWTAKDTQRFYEALRQLGTDFCSMEAFFENRNRKQLKRKYQSELIRNPALVEMALDPKNKTAIDLTVFDVEVDKNAIEAAAKDEPPPYIPTNGDESDKVSGATNDGVGNISKEEYEEVVEEDAEAESRAMAAAQSKTSKLRFSTEEPSIWSTGYGNEDTFKEDNFEEDYNLPEPSMDDFFDEQGDMLDDVDPLGGQSGAVTHSLEDKVETEKAAPVPSPAPKKATASAASISLVPSRANAKTKKPKFRTKTKKSKK